MMVAMMRVMFLRNITFIIASEVFSVMKCLEETENNSNGAAYWRREFFPLSEGGGWGKRLVGCM